MYRGLTPLVLLVFFICSCNKYEEGSAISFLSKEKMLFGYWKLDKWVENDIEITSQLQNKHEFGFALDGTYYYRYYDPGYNVSVNYTGTWEFRQQKEELVLGIYDSRFGMKYQVWNILRITKYELNLECVSPGKLVRWELIPQ